MISRSHVVAAKMLSDPLAAVGGAARHVDLDDMDVKQLTLHPLAQWLLHALQVTLLEEPYRLFGRCLSLIHI